MRRFLAVSVAAIGSTFFAFGADPSKVLHDAPELRGWTWSKHPSMIPSAFRPGPGDELILHETLAKDGCRLEVFATRYVDVKRTEAAIEFLKNTSQRYTPPVDVSREVPKEPEGYFFRRGKVLFEMYIVPPLVHGRPDPSARSPLDKDRYHHLLRRLLEAL